MPPMIRIASRTALFAFVLAAAAAAQGGGTAPPQAQEPAADTGLPDLLKELKSMVADPKASEDFRAIGLVQKLATDPDKRNPKDVERIAKALGDVFKTGKLRAPDKAHLYRETADALAKLGEDGGKELGKALAESRFKNHEYVALRAHLLLATGRTQDEKQIDLLVDEACTSPHDDVMGAAGEALGSYEKMDLKKRREVVKDLIRRYGSLHGKATELDPPDASAPTNLDRDNARATLRKIEGRWTATLSKLTGQAFTTQPDWQRWLNKNPSWTPPGGGRK